MWYHSIASITSLQRGEKGAEGRLELGVWVYDLTVRQHLTLPVILTQPLSPTPNLSPTPAATLTLTLILTLTLTLTPTTHFVLFGMSSLRARKKRMTAAVVK